MVDLYINSQMISTIIFIVTFIMRKAMKYSPLHKILFIKVTLT